MDKKAICTRLQAIQDLLFNGRSGAACDKGAIMIRDLKIHIMDGEEQTDAPGGEVQVLGAAVYGYCPYCGAPGVSRERRPNGNDTCENGHTYASQASKDSSNKALFKNVVKDHIIRFGFPASCCVAWKYLSWYEDSRPLLKKNLQEATMFTEGEARTWLESNADMCQKLWQEWASEQGHTGDSARGYGIGPQVKLTVRTTDGSLVIPEVT